VAVVGFYFACVDGSLIFSVVHPGCDQIRRAGTQSAVRGGVRVVRESGTYDFSITKTQVALGEKDKIKDLV